MLLRHAPLGFERHRFGVGLREDGSRPGGVLRGRALAVANGQKRTASRLAGAGQKRKPAQTSEPGCSLRTVQVAAVPST